MKRFVAIMAAVTTLAACSSTDIRSSADQAICDTLKAMVAEHAKTSNPETADSAAKFWDYVKSSSAALWPTATDADLKDSLQRIARDDNASSEWISVSTICAFGK